MTTFLRPALSLMLLMTAITGVIYPLTVAQIAITSGGVAVAGNRQGGVGRREGAAVRQARHPAIDQALLWHVGA